MSTFRKLAAAVIVLFIAVIAGLNIYLLRSGDSGTYRVEAKRLADRIEETGSTDISGFPHLTGVYSGEQLSIILLSRQAESFTVWNTRQKAEIGQFGL